jgi:hypothetical protein
MSKTIRRILLCVPVLAVLGLMTAAPAVRADPPDQTDTNAVWAYAEGPEQPNPDDGYNAYWQEVQDKQLVDPGQ